MGAKQFRNKSICREKAFGERAFREKNIWQLERLDVRVFWGERVSVLFPAPKRLLWSPGSLCDAAVGQREHKPHPAPPRFTPDTHFGASYSPSAPRNRGAAAAKPPLCGPGSCGAPRQRAGGGRGGAGGGGAASERRAP